MSVAVTPHRTVRPHARSAIVNGGAGLVVRAGPELRAVVGFTVAAGSITAIDVITDGQKLGGLAEPGPPHGRLTNPLVLSRACS